MSNVGQRVQQYLCDIIESIEQISEYTENVTQEDFYNNILIQDAVIRRFEIIGEACAKILEKDPDFTQKHISIHSVFHKAKGMRNHLIHQYGKVDIMILWNTIHNFLPEFYQDIKSIHYDITKSFK